MPAFVTTCEHTRGCRASVLVKAAVPIEIVP